jgi:hypothetical protein
MAPEEVLVFVDGVAASSNSYDVTLVGPAPSTGTVTFLVAPASGAEITIESDPDFIQDISFTNGGPFLAESHDNANDRAALRDIWLRDRVVALLSSVSTLTAGFATLTATVTAGIASAITQAVAAAQNTVLASTVVAGNHYTVSTLGIMKGLSGLNVGDVVELTQEGLRGKFDVVAYASVSVSHAADVFEGVYVRSVVSPTLSLVRQITANTVCASWWGPVGADSYLRLRSMELVRPIGSTVIFNPATYDAFGLGAVANTCAVMIYKSGKWVGAGRDTWFKHGAGPNAGTIGIFVSNFTMDGFRFSGLVTAANSGAHFHIEIGAHQSSGATEGAVTDHINLYNLHFHDSSTGIRAIRHARYVGEINNMANRVVYTPSKIHIANLHMERMGYQPVVMWCDESRIENFHIHMSGAGGRSFQHPFRLNATTKCDIINGRIYDEIGLVAFAPMLGGSTGPTPDLWDPPLGSPGQHRIATLDLVVDPAEIYISNVKCYGVGGMLQVLELADNLVFENCYYTSTNQLNTSTNYAPFSIGQNQTPAVRGSLTIRGGRYTGFSGVLVATGTNLKRILFTDVDFVGNDTVDTNNPLFAINNNGTDIYGDPIKGIEILEVENCRFLFKDGARGFGAFISGGVEGSFFKFKNNRFPNGLVTVAGASTANPIVQGSLTDNEVYPAGVWLKAVSDVRPNPRISRTSNSTDETFDGYYS